MSDRDESSIDSMSDRDESSIDSMLSDRDESSVEEEQQCGSDENNIEWEDEFDAEAPETPVVVQEPVVEEENSDHPKDHSHSTSEESHDIESEPIGQPDSTAPPGRFNKSPSRAWCLGEDKRKSTRRRRIWIAILVVLLFLVIIVAIAVPLANKEKEHPPRTADVVGFLAENGVSKLEDLHTEGTPQNKAATWIADVDRLHVPMSTKIKFIDRYVLTVLFFALGGDETWPGNANFLTPKHVCSWERATQNELGNSVTSGVHECDYVNDELRPLGISLVAHGLYGDIPEEIRFLDQLQTLMLEKNPGVGGSIPSGVSSLTNLKSFTMQHCSLAGSLPPWIGDLVELTNLGLGHNRISGTLPDSFQKLTKLEKLGLDDNNIFADLQEFGAMTTLQYLYLDDNQIQGKLSSSLLANWPQMVELDLSGNFLTSTIPEDLFSHKNLKVLDLHANSLTGSIPDVVVDNDQLEFLALQQNELRWSIPSSIDMLSSLKHLDLSMNSLFSPLPTTVGNMKNLRYLFIGENKFKEDGVPTFLSSLGGLEELSLRDMALTGTIPDSISSLLRLQFLDLSGNALTGTLPDSLGLLTNLAHLLLRANRLTGKLPDNFENLSDLDVLLLEENIFTGTADVVCKAESTEVTYFSSDCEGTQPALECSCCTVCCGDAEQSCNNVFWKGNLNPTWETGFEREKYDFEEGFFLPQP